MATAAANRGVQYALQTAATTGNGNIVAPPSSIRNHTIFLKGNATVSAGAVQIESADAEDYSGTWAAIGGGPVTLVSGAELVVTFSGIYPFIRCRISTTVTGSGGSLDANYVGQM